MYPQCVFFFYGIKERGDEERKKPITNPSFADLIHYLSDAQKKIILLIQTVRSLFFISSLLQSPGTS